MSPVPPLRIELPGSTGALGPVRRLLGAWLQRADVVDDGEWALIVTELMTNAIDASPAGSTIMIEARIAHGEVCVSVSDSGPGFDGAPGLLPDSSAIRGRGLHLIRAMSERVDVGRREGRTVVSVYRPAHRPVGRRQHVAS